MPAPAITVEDLKARRDRGDALTLVDVREPHEWAISDLPGSLKVPLGTLPQRLAELSKDAEIVVHCKTGGRSARAVQLLRDAGFRKVRNLAGGITRWSERIDPSMPRY